MKRTWQIRFLVLAAVLIGGMATSVYSHPTNSTFHESSTATANEDGYNNPLMGNTYEVPGYLSNTIEKEASSIRQSAPKVVTRAKRSAHAAAVQNKEDEGSKCLRGAPCVCTSSGHGVTNCYAGRGDCYNHEGILCLWE